MKDTSSSFVSDEYYVHEIDARTGKEKIPISSFSVFFRGFRGKKYNYCPQRVTSMPDWLLWITRYENSKIVALLLFFSVFCGILIYLFSSRKRSARLESYKYIPLNDDDPDVTAPQGEDKGNE